MITKEQRIKILEVIDEDFLEELVKEYPPFNGKSNKNVKDLTGKRNGRQENGNLIALYRVENKQPGHACWLCFNDLMGTLHEVAGYNFLSGHTQGLKEQYFRSRDYTREDKRLDLTGQQYGFLKVLYPTGNRKIGDNRIEWRCKCLACRKYH